MKNAELRLVTAAPAAHSGLVSSLVAAGFEATISGSEETVETLAAASFDLLLIDHDHPGFNAFAFVAQLRAANTLNLLPVIHLSRSLADIFDGGREQDGTPIDFYLSLPTEAPVLLSLVRAVLYARHAERLKDEFLSTLSHELRTPLNSIMGWADILLRQPREADFSQGLQSIERNARLQAQMIADVLDVSRMISGRLEIERGTIEPTFVIDAAIKAAAELAKPRQITIERRIDGPLPQVLADSERLQQVIANLLSNAVKFSAKNAAVVVEAARDGDHLRIAVIDSGRGIAAEAMPYVLDRFRRGSGGKSRGGGLGLGLTIAKHLTALHDGSLLAHSEGTGKGASFTILLPIAVKA